MYELLIYKLRIVHNLCLVLPKFKLIQGALCNNYNNNVCLKPSYVAIITMYVYRHTLVLLLHKETL